MDNAKIHEAPRGVKLTAVTMGRGRFRRQFFIPLPHDSRGHAIMDQSVLDAVLRQYPVPRTICSRM